MMKHEKILEQLKKLPLEAQADLLADLEQLEELKNKKKAKSEFLAFTRMMWPSFIGGRHHKVMAEAFERVARGELKRLIINMPPRHTKSEFASYLLPAWFLGQYPEKKVIQTAHTAELAVGFGRKVRNLIQGEDFKKVFQGIDLSSDSKAAGRWNTNKRGDYFAIGVGGAVTGKGADVLIIDDPHSEQDALSTTAFDNAYEWYTSGPRQRLQPGGAIVIVMTRWSTKDVTGQLLKAQSEEGSDQWEVVELPAILPDGKPVWPEFWTSEELLKTKASIPVSNWLAQYMQNPTSEEGAILKRDWWRDWTNKYPPPLDYIVQSYDTAFTKKTTSDFSAITTWGVFTTEADGQNIILLNAFKDRYDFPELRRVALEEYREWNPDMVIIEAKATGLPLTHELRQMDIPVINFTPSKGNDKHTRLNSVAPLFESGKIWAPMHEHFAQEVVEECASFPFGEYDDYVDSTTQAIMRIRQGGLVRHPEDYEDEPVVRGEVKYYG